METNYDKLKEKYPLDEKLPECENYYDATRDESYEPDEYERRKNNHI